MMRLPLTAVPFSEPRSRTHQVEPNRSKAAWTADTLGLWIEMSFDSSEPTVTRSESSVRTSRPPLVHTSRYELTSPPGRRHAFSSGIDVLVAHDHNAGAAQRRHRDALAVDQAA